MHLKHLIIINAILAFAVHDTYARQALVSVPVTPVRQAPAHASEMVTQALLGTPVEIVDDNEGSDWVSVVLPDSYEGYINRSALKGMTEDEMARWRRSSRRMIMPMSETRVVGDTLKTDARNVVTTLTAGAIVVEEKQDDMDNSSSYCHIILPDGMSGYVAVTRTAPLDRFAVCPIDYTAMTDSCHALGGTPHLWGGLSTKGMDCSGLVRIAFMTHGMILPRDAADQSRSGIAVVDNDALRCGDLLFFSPDKSGRITHVGIYDRDGYYIHCSGQVKVSHMDQDDPDFSRREYCGAVRIDGMDLQPGAVYVTSHPWYFDINK